MQDPASEGDSIGTDCIVLVAKVPSAGRCKTRLTPSLGYTKSAELAAAMLQDVIATFSADRLAVASAGTGAGCGVAVPGGPRIDSYWFYSPREEEHAAEELMQRAMRSSVNSSGDAKDRPAIDNAAAVAAAGAPRWCGRGWRLEANRREEGVDLDLGEVLLSLLISLGGLGYRSVTFIGGDTPYLSVAEVMAGVEAAHASGEAYICPSTDGGYVMLTVPTSVLQPSEQHHQQPLQQQQQLQLQQHQHQNNAAGALGAFSDIRWSSQHTCTDQIISLRKCGVGVRVGRTYTDIDEAQDLYFLVAMHSAATHRTQPLSPHASAASAACEGSSAGNRQRRAFSEDVELVVVAAEERESGEWEAALETEASTGELLLGEEDLVSELNDQSLHLDVPASPLAAEGGEWEHVSTENSLGYGQFSIVSPSGSDFGLTSTAQKLHLLESRSSFKLRPMLPATKSQSFRENRQQYGASGSTQQQNQLQQLQQLQPQQQHAEQYLHQQQQQQLQNQCKSIDESHISSYASQCLFTQRFMRQLLS